MAQTTKVALRGSVDYVGKSEVRGWVAPVHGALKVELIDRDGIVLASAECCLQRYDLRNVEGAMGFRLHLSSPINQDDFSTGDLRVLALQDGSPWQIPVWEKVLIAGSASVKFDKTTTQEAKNPIVVEPSLKKSNIDCLTTVSLIGRKSDNETAIIGYNGHIYLYRGSNDVKQMYSRASRKLTAGWTELIERRIQRHNSSRMKFLQVLIPEKSSLTPQFCPFSAGEGSPDWNSIVSHFKDRSSEFLDGLEVFKKSSSPHAMFLMQDTHLSTSGAKYLVQEIVRCLGYDTDIGQLKVDGQWVFRPGDLIEKFGDLSQVIGLEKIFVADSASDRSGRSLTPVLIKSFDPDSGHIGVARHWRCENALIDASVIVFGNSFFGPGRFSSGLSWWCSRIFREFRFVWSPDIDSTLVNEVMPDIIISQSIERFIRNVPID